MNKKSQNICVSKYSQTFRKQCGQGKSGADEVFFIILLQTMKYVFLNNKSNDF